MTIVSKVSLERAGASLNTDEEMNCRHFFELTANSMQRSWFEICRNAGLSEVPELWGQMLVPKPTGVMRMHVGIASWNSKVYSSNVYLGVDTNFEVSVSILTRRPPQSRVARPKLTPNESREMARLVGAMAHTVSPELENRHAAFAQLTDEDKEKAISVFPWAQGFECLAWGYFGNVLLNLCEDIEEWDAWREMELQQRRQDRQLAKLYNLLPSGAPLYDAARYDRTGQVVLVRLSQEPLSNAKKSFVIQDLGDDYGKVEPFGTAERRQFRLLTMKAVPKLSSSVVSRHQLLDLAKEGQEILNREPNLKGIL
ncbi:hypothetical protein FIU89_15220 [Roseovarius sp. THAF27]|uniref:hypothetical protein n=1 Tax=Roseovarius sp. THAF27 TaxID=2587850 RepID=UPI00126865CC|nr:hypothetical protein [Roseovarius sp. THAF27]QFT81974.1 hypothetical protein FIU89_15220 [Roseovarius sp. THAF27]